LKGRQIASEVERVGLRLQLRKQQAEAGDIILLFGDESEALTHPYLARVWAESGADLRVPAPGQAKKVAILGSLDLGSRSLGTRMGKPLKNRRCLSRDGAIWACANLRDGVKIIDLPLVSARHTERSRTHATHWSHHRSPSTNTDEFSKGPNQEVRFVLGLGTRAVRPGPEGP